LFVQLGRQGGDFGGRIAADGGGDFQIVLADAQTRIHDGSPVSSRGIQRPKTPRSRNAAILSRLRPSRLCRTASVSAPRSGAGRVGGLSQAENWIGWRG